MPNSYFDLSLSQRHIIDYADKVGQFTYKINAYRNTVGIDWMSTLHYPEDLISDLHAGEPNLSYMQSDAFGEWFVDNMGTVYRQNGAMSSFHRIVPVATQIPYIGAIVDYHHKITHDPANGYPVIAAMTSGGVEVWKWTGSAWVHQNTVPLPLQTYSTTEDVDTTGATVISSGNLANYPATNAVNGNLGIGVDWRDNWHPGNFPWIGFDFGTPVQVDSVTIERPYFPQASGWGELMDKVPTRIALEAWNGSTWLRLNETPTAWKMRWHYGGSTSRKMSVDPNSPYAGNSYSRWRIVILELVGHERWEDEVALGHVSFTARQTHVYGEVPGFGLDGDLRLWIAEGISNASNQDTGWRHITYYEAPYTTKQETEVYWPYPVKGFDTHPLENGKTIITFQSEVPGIPTILPVTDTEIEPETRLFTSGGLIGFVFDRGSISDFIEIDVLDIVDESNYISAPFTIYDHWTKTVYLLAHHSTGNQNYRSRGWRLYMSTDGYNWSKGKIIYQPDYITDNFNAFLPQEVVSFFFTQGVIGIVDPNYSVQGDVLLRPFWATNFTPDQMHFAATFDLTDHVLSYSFEHGDMFSSRIELSNTETEQSGYKLAHPIKDGIPLNKIFSGNGEVVLEHLHGAYVDPSADPNFVAAPIGMADSMAAEAGSPILFRVAYTKVDALNITRNPEGSVLSITTRSLMAWLNETAAEEPRYWKSQGAYGDRFNNWGEASYGALAHTAAARGEWNTINSHLYLVTQGKRCVAWNTFDTDIWNGIIETSFYIPPYPDDTIGVVFRAIDPDNYFWAAYYRQNGKIYLFKVREGQNVEIIAEADFIVPEWTLVYMRVVFKYARIRIAITTHEHDYGNDDIDVMVFSERDLNSTDPLKSLDTNPFERGYVGFAAQGNSIVPEPRISNIWYGDFKVYTFDRTFTVVDAINQFTSYAGLFDLDYEKLPASQLADPPLDFGTNGTSYVFAKRGLGIPSQDDTFSIGTDPSFVATWRTHGHVPIWYPEPVIYLTDSLYFVVQVDELNQRVKIIRVDLDDSTPGGQEREIAVNYNATVAESSDTAYTNFKLAFRQQRFTDNEEDVWGSITLWVNEAMVITSTFFLGKVYSGPTPHNFFDPGVHEAFTAERFPVVRMRHLHNDPPRVFNFDIPQSHQFVEWSSLDPGETVLSALNRAIEGRYIKMIMRHDNAIYIWTGEKDRPPVLGYNILLDLHVNEDYDMVAEFSSTKDLRKLVSHVRMIGAYAQAEYYDKEIAGQHVGHRFAELQNPFLMSEGECLYQAQREIRRHYQKAFTGGFKINYLKMIRNTSGDNLYYFPNTGLSFKGVIVSYSVTVTPADAIASVQYKELPDGEL